ncbi:hypothetical protein AB0I53_40345 [Saccharopolyspora sp. NPDC050389]|uniref:hypothetical protein n=1 Tax=Saccharopolyspora sp. NPDC050389 TaxID=3155516 RepID=UPI0033F75B3B
MTDFRVDLGGLDALRKNLERAMDNVDQATKRIQDAGLGSIGPAVLDEACADFRTDWKEGLDKIKETVEQITSAVVDTKQSYAELDTAISKNLEKMAADVAAMTRKK